MSDPERAEDLITGCFGNDWCSWSRSSSLSSAGWCGRENFAVECRRRSERQFTGESAHYPIAERQTARRSNNGIADIRVSVELTEALAGDEVSCVVRLARADQAVFRRWDLFFESQS